MDTSTVLRNAWVVASIVAVFASWVLLLAVIVDNAHMPAERKPGMFVRMIVYTTPIPLTLSTLAYVVMWR